MRGIKTIFLIIASVVFFASCNRGGVEPVEMGEMEKYSDPLTKFEVMYPSNWFKIVDEGQFFWAYSDSLARKRFNGYDAEGFPGGKISVIVKTIDTAQNTYKNILTRFGEKFQPEFYTEKTTIDMNGIEVHKYVYEFQRIDGLFKGITYVGTTDSSTATILEMEAFANTFDEMYKEGFQKIADNFKLAETMSMTPDTLFVSEEAEPPSENLKTVSGDGFSISIPDNFGKERDLYKSKSAINSYLYLGERRGDCQIKVEIFDAKGAKLQKIVDDSKSAFGNANPSKTTLGGKEAFMIAYAPTSDLKGKVWFAINNDKLYRVLITWYVPEADDYKSIFEKSVGTFSFK